MICLLASSYVYLYHCAILYRIYFSSYYIIITFSTFPFISDLDMNISVHILVIFCALCGGSVRLAFSLKKFKGKESLHNVVHMTRDRHTRAIPLAKLGEMAITFLVKGAKEIPTPNHYYKEFSKWGTPQTAIGDFRSVAKTDNRKRKTQFGEDFYEGVIGDKKVRLILNDRTQDGNPSILLYDAKTKGCTTSKLKLCTQNHKQS